jgi:hypothetical protein
MIAKKKIRDVLRINLLHKIWSNIQKNDHMMATLDRCFENNFMLHQAGKTNSVYGQ